MKRAIFAIVIIVVFFVVVLISSNNGHSTIIDYDPICTNLPDGTKQCFENAATYVYVLSEGTLTVPDDIVFTDALATYNAYIADNAPTAAP